MLAAVLVIVGVAVYYVMTAGGFPAVGATATTGEVVGEDENDIVIKVETGSIPAGDWAIKVKNGGGEYLQSYKGNTFGSETWVTGTDKLKASYVLIANSVAADNYWVTLKHVPSGHVYFSGTKLTIE